MHVNSGTALTLGLISAVFAVYYAPVESSPSRTGDGSHHRAIRSPQFGFPGGNVLTDLTKQLKPPSLEDLNEFRKKMASLANFTAMLEHALEAEKRARSTLQNLMAQITDQINGVQTAVNPDPENYWTESKECGGILVSQTGRITYKKNEFYQDHERCVWTVRANYRSKIKLTLTSSGLEDHHDYVAVTELDENKINSNWVTKRITAGQTNIFKGPIVFITFFADGSIRKKGFQLDFEGMGSNTNGRTVYQHYHLTDWMGQFDSLNLSKSLEANKIKIENGNDLKATIVVNPSYWNYSKLELNIPETNLDLRPSDCEKTALSILNGFPLKEYGASKRCCGSNCEQEKFQTSDRAILAIFSSSDLSDGSQFLVNWSTDTSATESKSVDTCGGLLKSDLGRISYKASEKYDNNERCVWIVSAEMGEHAEIKLHLLKDGFEYHYDYLTYSYFLKEKAGLQESVTTEFLYKSSEPVSIPAHFVIIEFYSDAGNFGNAHGFELTWEVKYTSGSPIITEFDFTGEPAGSKELSCYAQHETVTVNEGTVYHFQIINAHYQNKDVNGSVSLHLSIENEDDNQLKVLNSERGNFSFAETAPSGSYWSLDGILVVFSKCNLLANDGKGSNGLITWKTEIREDAYTENDIEKQFVKSVDQCGEVLYGNSGRISYKLGKEYNLQERCTWIIKAKTLSTVSFQLMADGFESCCDGIQINRVDTKRGLISPEAVFINRENRFKTLEGPILLVTFFSDHSVVGTGFSIEFQTKGSSVVEDVPIHHWHAHLTSLPSPEEPFGPVFIQLSENSMSIDAFQFDTVNETKVVLSMDNMQTNECLQDSVALYDMPEITKYELLKRHPNDELCPLLGNPVAVGASSLVFQQETMGFKGFLLVVSKVKEANDEKSLSLIFQ